MINQDKKYSVTGHFYELPGKNGPYECRSVLEIALHTCGSSLPVDAIIVMMNPGGSRPCPLSDGSTLKGSMVPAIPDQTQYQIMALMDKRAWGQVRVLNLSDLINADSRKFREKVREFKEEYGDERHSIFSPCRAIELRAQLERASGAPIIVAWGSHNKLIPLAELAQRALSNEWKWVVGKPAARGGLRYWHPLLRNAKWQHDWLEHVSGKLDKFTLVTAESTR